MDLQIFRLPKPELWDSNASQLVNLLTRSKQRSTVHIVLMPDNFLMCKNSCEKAWDLSLHPLYVRQRSQMCMGST